MPENSQEIKCLGCFDCKFFSPISTENRAIRDKKIAKFTQPSQYIQIPPPMSGTCDAYPSANLLLTTKGFRFINTVDFRVNRIISTSSRSFCTVAKLTGSGIAPCYDQIKSVPR